MGGCAEDWLTRPGYGLPAMLRRQDGWVRPAVDGRSARSRAASSSARRTSPPRRAPTRARLRLHRRHPRVLDGDGVAGRCLSPFANSHGHRHARPRLGPSSKPQSNSLEFMHTRYTRARGVLQIAASAPYPDGRRNGLEHHPVWVSNSHEAGVPTARRYPGRVPERVLGSHGRSRSSAPQRGPHPVVGQQGTRDVSRSTLRSCGTGPRARAWKHWPCLFPQHGPGRKHERKIRLEAWQRDRRRAPGRLPARAVPLRRMTHPQLGDANGRRGEEALRLPAR